MGMSVRRCRSMALSERGSMADDIQQTALGDVSARQLANATKSAPQMSAITPRWLTRALQWVPVEAGIFRLNRVKDASRISVECSARDERVIPQTYVDYEDHPRELLLSAVNSVVDIHTRVAHLYSAPYSQVSEQLRLTIEIIKERQESELINNPEYGLLANVAPEFRLATRTGAPTPDDLDELLSRVWKEPGFFLAHPLAIAAFGRECTRRGRAAANRLDVRRPVHHLARRAADPVEQDTGRRQHGRRSC